MDKPRPPHNIPDISEGPGDRAAEEGGEGLAKSEEEGRVGKQGGEAKDPPAEGRNNRRAMRPERAGRRQRRKRTRRGKRRRGTGTERPHGGHR